MITADQDTIRSLVQDIERASHFGQRPVPTAPGLVGGLTAVLEAHLMRALGDYHLEHGATLLRGLVYLDRGRTLATTTAARFLQDNQTEEGYFGFFDPEIRLMRSRANDPTAELGLLAPTLLAVLWALAEFERDDYRLYRDLGRGYREHGEEIG
jgi:hypothetical protein